MEELSINIDSILSQINDQKVKKELKQYVRNKIILDNNINDSKAILNNGVLELITLFVAIPALSNIIEENYIILFLLFLMFLGLYILKFNIIKKHLFKKYANEKSFCEILLSMLEE